MKSELSGAAFFILTALIVLIIITSGVMLFGLFIAYILTLMIDNLEMRQAIIPGSVLAPFSMHFCFKLITNAFTERDHVDSSDESSENYDDRIQNATEAFQDFVLKIPRTKPKKKKTTQQVNPRGWR